MYIQESVLKPDFIVNKGTTAMMIDVAYLFDLYIHNAYQEKIRKYKVVQNLLNLQKDLTVLSVQLSLDHLDLFTARH